MQAGSGVRELFRGKFFRGEFFRGINQRFGKEVAAEGGYAETGYNHHPCHEEERSGVEENRIERHKNSWEGARLGQISLARQQPRSTR